MFLLKGVVLAQSLVTGVTLDDLGLPLDPAIFGSDGALGALQSDLSDLTLAVEDLTGLDEEAQGER